MEVLVWSYCIVINFIVINYSTAKPFSLNEALAAELDQKQITEASTSKLPEKTAESAKSMNKILKPTSSKSNIFKEAENIFLRVKKISPLKYRKTFEIKTPLKPRHFKRSPKSKLRRKNQSVKREINGNEQLNQKYIPLLKSIGMLFDNLLVSDESGSYEIRSRKYKRNRYQSIFTEEANGMECTCAHRSNNENAKSKSPKKTVAVETAATEISIDSENFAFVTTTTETTDTTSTSDISSVGLYQNISLLLPRDTVSSWGNDIGISERSSSTHNGSVEGNLAWNHGNNEHGTGCGENESITKNGDEITCNAPRNNTSGDGSYGRQRRNGNNTRSPNAGFTFDESKVTAENENFSKTSGYATKHERSDKLEMGRDETESAKSLSELIRRLRGYVSEVEVTANSDAVQPEKVNEESIVNVAHDNPSHKQFSDRSSSNTKEDKKIGARNETMILTKTSTTSETKNYTNMKTPPVVMIIDGYSVTRNKNGENKLAKKAIHIHS